ncbi:MAG: hypothetical protein KBE09_03495 [Candidatus Pacebacteria bacterium]|nr:hypothetical protein [Candidatus Paceibacterota bacterium]
MWQDFKKSFAQHLGRYLAIGLIALVLGVGGVLGAKWYWQSQKDAITASTKAKVDAARKAADTAIEKTKDAAGAAANRVKDAAQDAADIAREKAKRAAERTRDWRESVFGSRDAAKEPAKQ